MKCVTYRKATLEDLEALWTRNIADNPGDVRWERWKNEYIAYHVEGKSSTFAVVIDGIPVGEGTLLFSPECRAVAGSMELADGVSVANVNALRICKAYEGQGHISALMRLMESSAKAMGMTRLTIGVDARETRNLAIYLHWGFRDFVASAVEDDELVLYYAKEISVSG